MAKIVEYNPYRKGRKTTPRKTAKRCKSSDSPWKMAKPTKQRKTLSNPFTSKGGKKTNFAALAKDGGMIAAGFAGAWASNKYIWAMLPASISGSESMTKVRGAIPAAIGIFLAGRKSVAGRKIASGLIAGGLFDILAGFTNGMVPTLGGEKIVYRPVPVARVGFEAPRRAPSQLGMEAPRTLQGSNSGRSSLPGVLSV